MAGLLRGLSWGWRCRYGAASAAQPVPTVAPAPRPRRRRRSRHSTPPGGSCATTTSPKAAKVDWDALRAELRPRAEQAATDEEARVIIRDMLERIGQSHFAIVPAPVASAMAAARCAPKTSARSASTSGCAGQALVVTSVDPRAGGQGRHPCRLDAHARERAARGRRALRARRHAGERSRVPRLGARHGAPAGPGRRRRGAGVHRRRRQGGLAADRARAGTRPAGDARPPADALRASRSPASRTRRPGRWRHRIQRVDDAGLTAVRPGDGPLRDTSGIVIDLRGNPGAS